MTAELPAYHRMRVAPETNPLFVAQSTTKSPRLVRDRAWRWAGARDFGVDLARWIDGPGFRCALNPGYDIA